MSDTDLPDLEHLVRQRNELARAVNELDEKTLAELHRRAGGSGKPSEALQEGAGSALHDGYGRGNAEVVVTSSDVSRPVEATVVSFAGGDDDRPDTWAVRSDPIVGLVAKMFDDLGKAVGHVTAIQRTRRRLDLVGGAKGRGSSLQGSCKCCDRDVSGGPDDRLRSGYCEPCYRAWVDAGKPGSDPQVPGNPRVRWEEQRRVFLKSGDGRSKRSRAS